jgi:hypothetical protein
MTPIMHFKLLNRGIGIITFYKANEILFSMELGFHEDDEYYIDEALEYFLECIEEEIKTLDYTSENCYNVVTEGMSSITFSKHQLVLEGYSPSLLNRYSEN